MKNNELIQAAALVALAAALLYRKYGKKKKSGQIPDKTPGKSFNTSQPPEEDYLPYSKKENKE